MATNLHALIRYRIIDKCLRNHYENWSWEELAIACEKELLLQVGLEKRPSRRTIFSDLANMKSGKLGYHAPIEYDKKLKSYYYTDSKFSIRNVPLKQEEINELKNALLILKQFSGKEALTGLSHSIAKLEGTLNIKQGITPTKEIIQFEHSLNEPGQKWVNQIYYSIKNKEALTIAYVPFDKNRRSFVVSPYLLKENNNRWFCFAFDHNYEDIITLGLDRIVEIKKSLQSYIQENNNLEDFFNDIVGVSKPIDQTPITILLKVYGLQRLYFETKPIHISQRTEEINSDFGIFSIKVAPNFELEAKILSLGEKIEVLEPIELRRKIAVRLSNANMNYPDLVQ